MTFKRLAHLLPALAIIVLLSFGLRWACLADMTVTKEVTNTVGDKKTTFDQTTYWTKTRMSTDDPSGKIVIIDVDAKTITILDPKEKKYIQDSFEDVKKREAAVPEQVRKQITGMKVSVRETGQKRTIDGYPCEKLVLTAGPTEITVWATKKITIDPVVAAFDKEFLALTRDIATLALQAKVRAVFEKRNVYPYVTIVEVPLPFAGQTQTSESKLKKVDYEKVDPSVFAVPSGYERITVPASPSGK
jgi:hypothetical protein